MNLIDKIKFRIEVQQDMIALFTKDLERARVNNDPHLRESSRINIETSRRIVAELKQLLEV